MDLTELEKLLQTLQRFGVIEYESEQLKLKLGRQPEKEESHMPSDPLKAAFQKDVLGKDGLTKEQQEDLYGSQVDEF